MTQGDWGRTGLQSCKQAGTCPALITAALEGGGGQLGGGEEARRELEASN